MMNEKVTIEKIAIPLGIGKEDKFFASIEHYNDFMRAEREFWSWLNGPSTQVLKSYVRKNFIEYQFNQVSEENVTSHLKILKEKTKSRLPLYSFTPEGQFINSVFDKYGYIIASFAIISISDLTYTALSDALEPNGMLKGLFPRYSNQNSWAVSLVVLFRHELDNQCVGLHLASAHEAHGQFMSTLSSLEEGIVQSSKKHKEKLDEVISLHESLYEEAKSKFKRISLRCIRAINRVRTRAKSDFEQSRADLRQAAIAYHEQVDLDASVTYWKSKRDGNNRKASIWFIFGIGGSVGATFYLLAKYYAKGGIVGIAANLADTADKAKIAGIDVANNVQSVAAATTTNSGMEHLVFNTTGAALVVTLMAVIIRVALRQFNTYSHLSLEAEERVTMVKTYLALLNEGKLNSDQDRHLALEALFRTSQTGMIAETSFNSPVDIIVKSLADKAKV